jgi:hypothetical protein
MSISAWLVEAYGQLKERLLPLAIAMAYVGHNDERHGTLGIVFHRVFEVAATPWAEVVGTTITGSHICEKAISTETLPRALRAAEKLFHPQDEGSPQAINSDQHGTRPPSCSGVFLEVLQTVQCAYS